MGIFGPVEKRIADIGSVKLAGAGLTVKHRVIVLFLAFLCRIVGGVLSSSLEQAG